LPESLAPPPIILPPWAVTLPRNWDDEVKGISDIDTDMRSPDDPLDVSSKIIERKTKKSKKLKKLKKNIGKGLRKNLQDEVITDIIHRRSLDPDANWLDFQLMEVFNAVDTCSILWSDGVEHICSEAFQSIPSSLEAKLYHKIVRQPIGLRNIHTKIQRGDYDDVNSLAKDLRKMIHNAKLYNLPGSVIHSDATRLSQALQTIMSKQYSRGRVRELAQKQSSVRRRQARNAVSPQVADRKRRSSSSSKTSLCELCGKYERPKLPGDGCPIGQWYCGDCLVNPKYSNTVAIIGRDVRVWWESDQEYYIGTILAYDERSGCHRVFYNVDHDWEFLDLSTQSLVFTS
jgi:hypothetical protein